MPYFEPWSKKHKSVTANACFSLSNSFAQPLSSQELVELSLQRGDKEIVELYHKHPLVYTSNGGSLDLRTEIARLYGPNINAENIVVLAGGQVALQTAAIALLDNDSHSIVFTPGYQSVQVAPRHAGSQVTTILLRPEDNWQINPEKVEAAIHASTKYIVINEPYNPAGTLMSHQLQERLVEIAKSNDLYLLSDEAYRFLEHDANDRLLPIADLYNKGMSVCTLSKPWGGCGITVGWIALQDLDIRQKLIDTQYFGTTCPSRASEIQAIMTLRASDIILKKNLGIIGDNLAMLDEFFERYGNLFEWVRPRAGTVAFVKFKGPLTSEELGEQLAKSRISIKPAYVFTEDVKRYSDYFRIGFGEKNMPEALNAFIDFVEDHKQEWLK
jgi:aspartate/methionine/tyrosine aminotransferase